MSEEQKQASENALFRSLAILRGRWQDGTFGEILEDWKFIFSYSRRYRGAIVFYTLLGIFSSTLALVSGVVSKYVIDIVTGYQYDKLGLLAAVMVGTSVFNLIFSSLLNRVNTKLSLRINHEIQADIFDKIMDAEWLEITKYRNGDILNRFTNDTGTIAGNAVSWIPNIIIAVYNFIATFIVIWHYSHIMSLLSFASAPVMLLMSRFVIRRQREYNKKSREMSSKVMTFEVETFYNMDTIKSFGISPLYGEKLRGWQDRYKDIYLEHNLFTIKTNIFMNVMGRLIYFGIFGYCLYLLWTHEITYGTMTLFLTQRSRMSSAFNNIVSIVPSFLTTSVSAHRIKELAELPKEAHIPAEAEDLHNLSVVMEDVDFGYDAAAPVLQNVSFKAEPGEIAALVGPSGQGKTTMIRLMLGLVTPQKGTAGIITEKNTFIPGNADIRRYFSYVPQGNTILSGTVAENMRIVKEDATDEEIISCLKTACAWEFIERMPQGINNPVGERGRGLSEGQAQRLAIARALLRDAPVLLLDEATSALDVATEREVLSNIMGDHAERTCIVTTHRPSVLTMCSRVYGVMEKEVRELSEEESAR
ncbi:MAG: ABC transporter ATP-binding protein, partial [Solobacterium sp.]|nr:ABC transporter ATP-binding protein [Solobacterium sp.]